MTFHFAVPELAAAQPTVAEPQHAKALAGHLDHLGQAAALQALCQYLHESNRLPLRPEDRLQALEALQPATERLLEDLANLYITHRLPLTGEARDAAAQARSLLIELGYGYKRVLMEYTHKLTTEGRRTLPFLLSRLMRVLATSLSSAYSTYSPTPAGTWQELHQLYHYASFYGLDRHALNAGEDGQPPATLASIYREVLLFALIDPYHLQPGEARTVQILVGHFQRFLQIEPYREDENGAGLFLIQTSQDKPPRPLSMMGGTVIAPMDKLLDARELIQYVHLVRQRYEDGDNTELAALPITEGRLALLALLTRLERHWSSPPRRAFHRQPGRHVLELAPGLQAIAALAAPDLSAPAADGRRPVSLPGGAGRNSQASERWQVINESPGGLALRQDSKVPTRVVVGEQIAVRHAESGAWQPGVVRWVHDAPDSVLECGVQLQAPRLQVLTLRLDAADSPARPALQLPALANLQRPALLVLARGSFGAGRQCWVNGPEGTAVLRMTRLEDHTQSVEMVEFKPA